MDKAGLGLLFLGSKLPPAKEGKSPHHAQPHPVFPGRRKHSSGTLTPLKIIKVKRPAQVPTAQVRTQDAITSVSPPPTPARDDN